MQIDGAGYNIEGDRLRRLLDEHTTLRKLLLRYVEAYAMQTTHTALSNTVNTLEERLVRWLLTSPDGTAQTLFIQTSQSTVTNVRHPIQARLARWLLMFRDRYDSDEIPLTHEFMVIMAGAHPSGMTIALHVLEDAGMIRSAPGQVTIVDRAKLEEVSGDSHRRI